MKQYNFLLIGSFFILLFSCKTNHLSIAEYDKPMIIFGSGGGFSGIETSFTLLSDGRLYTSNLLDSTHVELGVLESNLAKQIFLNYHDLGLNDLNLDNPGNTYKFIAFNDGENTHKITWDVEENRNLSNYYHILRNLSNSFKSK